MASLEDSVFISYAHEDKPLARALAGALQARGVQVWIDEGEMQIGDSLIEKISTAIAGVDYFLALVSEASAESKWCKKELALAVTGELGREGVKVLPVRVGDAPMPASLGDVYHEPLSSANVDEVASKVAEAIPKHAADQRKKTELRRAKARRAPSSRPEPASTEEDPIRILGVVEEGVSQPRNDGTRGSALYRVPLRLSRTPSRVWATHFVNTWDRPPRWTPMHSPGIASVSGDTVTLDGTTMDELEKYHVETLRHVLAKVNDDVAQYERDQRVRAEKKARELAEHEENVRDTSSRLKFD